MSIFLHFLITVFTVGALTISLNLVVGTTGLLQLGHAGFFGIGAYTSALLVLRLGLPWFAAFVAAGVVAALVGTMIGLLTLKLKGDYFAITTLGFSVILEAVLTNWRSLTRGPVGIPGIPAPGLLGYSLQSLPAQAVLAGLLLAVTYVVVQRLTDAPFGLALRAVREDEIAARALGAPVLRLKVQAAAISAGLAGLAGSLQAHYIRFIDPKQFGFYIGIFALVAVIFGGLGNHLGSLLGAAVLTLLQQGLPYLGLPPSQAGPLQQLLLALALIAFMLFRPRGLLPERRVRSGAGEKTNE